MISLRNENLKIKKSNKDGNPGNDGAGGFGGKGGKKENSVHLNCHYKWRKPTACSDQMKLEDWYLENEEDDPKRGKYSFRRFFVKFEIDLILNRIGWY